MVHKILRWTHVDAAWLGITPHNLPVLAYVVSQVDPETWAVAMTQQYGVALKASTHSVGEAKQLAELHARQIFGPSPKVL